VAEMEMDCIVATIFYKFEWNFAEGEKQGLPGGRLETREGFLRKPLALKVGVKERK
jgi:benzoate 4-monooxygenase